MVQALYFFKQALELAKKVYGDQHPEVIYSQKMGLEMLKKLEGSPNDPPFLIRANLILLTVLSNFEELKPIIGDPNQYALLILLP